LRKETPFQKLLKNGFNELEQTPIAGNVCQINQYF